MQIVRSISQLRELVASEKAAGRRVAFVPTMGNLHAGHISLVEEAKRQGDCVVVSIFVNPLQFGANEDLDAYPRTFEADSEKLIGAGASILFFPEVKEIYPRPLETMCRVTVPEISELWCGASRPGHFDGVSTVVNKLFNMVQPDVALFGEKDFQQLMLIRRMVDDLNMPIEIVGVPIVREQSGLAMSSRNGYLTEEERSQAAGLYRQLQSMAQQLIAGENDFRHLESEGRASLDGLGFKTDYLTISRADSLQPVQHGDKDVVILAAAWLGRARLLDNIQIQLG